MACVHGKDYIGRILDVCYDFKIIEINSQVLPFVTFFGGFIRDLFRGDFCDLHLGNQKVTWKKLENNKQFVCNRHVHFSLYKTCYRNCSRSAKKSQL